MQDQDKLKLSNIPLVPWLIGFYIVGISIFIASHAGYSCLTTQTIAIGLIPLLLMRGLTVTADQSIRVLQLRYWSLGFWRTTWEIPFDEIQTIQVGSKPSPTRLNRNAYTYRIELIRKDGSVVPFRTLYTIGLSSKQKMADKLCAFIGL